MYAWISCSLYHTEDSFSTTGTSVDSMMRWSRRSRWTRAVATITRSAGSRRLLHSQATSEAISYVRGRTRNNGLASDLLMSRKLDEPEWGQHVGDQPGPTWLMQFPHRFGACTRQKSRPRAA